MLWQLSELARLPLPHYPFFKLTQGLTSSTQLYAISNPKSPAPTASLTLTLSQHTLCCNAFQEQLSGNKSNPQPKVQLTYSNQLATNCPSTSFLWDSRRSCGLSLPLAHFCLLTNRVLSVALCDVMFPLLLGTIGNKFFSSTLAYVITLSQLKLKSHG